MYRSNHLPLNLLELGARHSPSNRASPQHSPVRTPSQRTRTARTAPGFSCDAEVTNLIASDS
eukprot:88650-Prymnesium_polylepis.1